MHTMTLGYSPCPNDTHIFYALKHGLVDAGGLHFKERLEDVETLNQLALKGLFDISKVSYHAAGFIRNEYCVLRSGGALGRGCGPLVVTRQCDGMTALKGKRVALPGRLTTASLLFQLYGAEPGEVIFLPFHEIMEAVRSGEADAGVIIHESRFTFASYGLISILDLGDWWELETGFPIPLGCIVARRSLGASTLKLLERVVRDSVVYAKAHPDEALGYIGKYAQEMSAEVCKAHIQLYVNEFSIDLGREGEAAVIALLARAEERGLVPKAIKNLFNW